MNSTSSETARSEQCPECERASGIYHFTLACCRTRFLLECPDRVTRKAWLALWRERYGEGAVLATKERLWEASREASA